MDSTDQAEQPRVQRAPRHATKLDVSIQRAGEHPIESFISDLSLDGCRVAGYFRQDEALTLTIPGIGRFDARVKWARFGNAGVQFVRR